MKIQVNKLFSLDGHKDCVYSLEQGPTANLFYSAAGDGMVVQWDLKNPEVGQLLAKMNNSVYALHFMPSENILLAGQNFEGLHFIDVESKKDVGSIQLSKSQIFDIKSYEGLVYIGSADGMLYVIDLKARSILKRIKLSDKSVRTVVINETLGDIAVGLSDNTIRILDLEDHKPKYLINAHKLSVFTLAYDPVTNNLVSGSRDAHLKVWSSFDQYQLHNSIVAHMYAINCISISPNQQHFVSCSMDKSIKVWDLASFKLLKVIDKSRHAGHATSVNKVLWTDYYGQLVSCSDDQRISIWDLRFETVS